MSACTNEVSLGSMPPVLDVIEEVPPASPEGCLAATPFRVEFGVVRRDELVERELRITNGCDVPIELSGFTLSGDSDFGVAIGEQYWKATPETATTGVELNLAWSVPPRGEVIARLSYEASQPAPADGVLVWRGEVDQVSLSLVVKLSANQETPCIATQPKTLDYGGKVVGDTILRDVAITSCGDGELRIDGVQLTMVDLKEGAEAPFILKEWDEPLPWLIAPGETRVVAVQYTPEEVAGLDEEGDRLRDRATLLLKTNAFDGDHLVSVRGFGVLDACPEAVIEFAGSPSVPAATSVLFQGGASWSIDGAITSYHWTRERPGGEVEALGAGSDLTSVSVELSTIGEHVVRLSVEDDTGQASCAPAEAVITVLPNDGLHVELVWTTDGDPNPLDQGFEKGTDLDLHLLHPLAVGEDVDGDGSGDGWFDDPLDVFWGNLHPNWGQVGDPKVTDDPELLRDDVDSLGPEIVILGEPQAGASYRIGVHSWSEHGFGPSKARVRIWIGGVLKYSSALVLLHEGDLWEVGAVEPSAGQVAPLLGAGDAPQIWQLEPGLLSKD